MSNTRQQAAHHKIAHIQPNQKHLNLQFEISEIISLKKDGLHCRIVDDTGIVNAYFDKYADKLQPNIVYQMSNLKSKVVSNHLQIQMSRATIVEKQPAVIGFKDKSNDISKKFYVAKKDQATQNSMDHQVNQENHPKHEVLIPLTKEEAKHEMQLKKKFYQNTKPGKNLEKNFQKTGKKQKTGNEKKKEKNPEKTHDKANQKVQKQGKSERKQKNGEKQILYKQKQSIDQSTKSNPIKYKEKNSQTVKKYKQKTVSQKMYREKTPEKKFMKKNDESKTQKSSELYSGSKTKEKSFSRIYVEKPISVESKQIQKEEVVEQKKSQQCADDIKSDDFGNSNVDRNQKFIHQLIMEDDEKQPYFVQDQYSEPLPYMDLKDVVSREGEHVNICVWVSKNERNKQQSEYDCLIADKTGSLWARLSHQLQIEVGNWYEIDNLFVFEESNEIMLKSTEFSEAKLNFEKGKSFAFKPIKK